MIIFQGEPLSTLAQQNERISRFFVVDEARLRARNRNVWGAGIIYAEPGLIRVQTIEPPISYDFSQREFADSAQEYVKFAESAAGVIVAALKLSETDFRVDNLRSSSNFGESMPFDHKPVVRQL